jgi:imidazole glycerol phosphate synthase glutamine amidotransferase subunit
MNIEVLDLGINNIKSVAHAISRINYRRIQLRIISDLKESKSPDLIILPGLGHFEAGMREINKRRFDILIDEATNNGSHVAGICLGMQLLAEKSQEAPGVKGLGLIPGEVEKLPSIGQIPHVGWESTYLMEEQSTFQSLASSRDFYFVHSYHFNPTHGQDILARSSFYHLQFVAGVIRGNVLGVQFHPEKSGKAGVNFLSEVIQWAEV